MRARPHHSARKAISIVGLTALIATTLQVMAAPTAFAAPPVFADDFTAANFANWTASTRLTIDSATGAPGTPSARAQVTAQSAFAYRTLASTLSGQVCMSSMVNVASGSGIDLFRLRTAANGGIVKVALASNGNLQVRSDFAGTSINSGVALGTGWHNVELCGTVGTSSTWDLYRDGVRIVNAWAASTGTTPVGRIQIGDAAAATFTANFDHVVLDDVVGEDGVVDNTPPSTPGQPTGSSPSVGVIQISWTGSTDISLPITYRIFRDGGGTAIGTSTTTSYTDTTGLVAGSSHTYRVSAVDSQNNVSPLSPASASITVTSTNPGGNQPVPGHTRLATDVPRNNVPIISTGEITDLAYLGNRVFIVGSFTSLRNNTATNTTTVNQARLAAYNIDTGLIDTNFRPTFDGSVSEVEITPDGTRMFVIGRFNTVNGVTKRKIASINPVTGAVNTGFTANANSAGTAIEASNTTVYVGGHFTKVNNTARISLAAVNATTGALVPGFVNDLTGGLGVNGEVTVQALRLTHDGSKLLVVHTARQIAGQDRYGMGLIDTATNQLLPWRSRLWDDNLQFVGGVTRIYAGDIAPNDQYFVVTSGSGGDRPPISDTAVAFPIAGGDNVQPLWVSRCFDSVYSVAISENAVYLGGHFNYQESPTAPDPWPGLDNVGYGRGQGLAGYGLGDDIVIRDHVGAVDPATGKALEWNPGSNSFEGNKAMLVTPRGVFTGGDGNTQGGQNGGRVAFYDFNSIPTPGQTETAIVTPIEGRVEVADVQFSVDGTATATSGVQRVELEVKERDTNRWLQDDRVTWGNVNTITVNLASPNANSTNWSLPLTIAGNHRIRMEARAYGGNGSSDTSPAVKKIETFGLADNTPTTGISGPSGSVIPTTTFTVTGTAQDDIGVNAITFSIRDAQNRYLQDNGDTDNTFNTFRVTPDVVGATSATWQYEVTLPYESTWTASATAIDTIGQSDLRSAVRTWIVSATAVPPTVTIATPAVMIPPTAIGALTMSPGSPVTFSGTATDDEGLNYVEIRLRNSTTQENLSSGGTWGTGVAAGDYRVSPGSNLNGTTYNWSYTTPFNLRPGTYTFSVQATDDLNLTTSSANQGRLTINVQVPGDAFPDTTISPTGTVNGLQVLHLDLAGIATDDIGVSAVRLTIRDQDSGLYLQNNGTLSGAYSLVNATLANPGATSTAWTLSVNLPTQGDYAVTAFAYDTSDQQDPSSTGATSRYPIYPGDLPPIVLNFSLVDGTAFTEGKIVVSGRVEDDQQIAQANVAIRNGLGQYMSSSGAFTSTTVSWRTAFLNSPGSPGSNFAYTSPLIPSGSYTVFVRGVDQHNFTTTVPLQANVTVTGTATSLPPVANFTSSCAQNVCTFDGRSSTDENAATLIYSWNFGQGSGSGPVPIKTYTSPGAFTVTLTVRDENGLTGVASRTVSIVEPAGNLPPVAVINPPSCAARVCNISGVGSSDPNVTDTFTYLWNFGDATATSTSSAPSHTFAADGTYTVTLTVTDGWGDANSTTRVITIAKPVTNVAPTPVISAPVCLARACNFFGTASFDPNGDAFTYLWNWGDGTATGTGATPTHTFATDNTFIVTLTVTDAWGDFASTTRNVTIAQPGTNAAPVPVIGAPSCVLRVCSMSSAGSADPEGDAFTYLWNFGDGTATSTASAPSHTFPGNGPYTVSLTLTDAWGKASVPATRVVSFTEPGTNVAPIAVIDLPNCLARTCTLTGAGSSDPNGDTFTYLWNFGDGTATSTSATAVHLFALDGSYTVTLTLTDVWGRASAPVTRVVTITKPPTNQAPTPVINPVSCNARVCTIYGVSSSDPNSDSFTYLWNFGDGTATSTSATNVHTFAIDNTYIVTLTVTDAWGDAATTTRSITIAEPVTNVAPVAVIPVPSCAVRVCAFTSTGSADANGDTFTYLWNFGDGTATSTSSAPTHTYALVGTYTVTLTVTDGWGRAGSITRVVVVT